MYIVIEIQKSAENTIATLVNSYANISDAENKYHTVLAFAAISALPIHSCAMLSEDGYLIKRESYIHQQEVEEVEEIESE